MASLAKPALLADRYGTTAYATIAGILATPITLARAAAPLGAAGLHAAGGYPLVLAAVAACCLAAALGVLSYAAIPHSDEFRPARRSILPEVKTEA